LPRNGIQPDERILCIWIAIVSEVFPSGKPCVAACRKPLILAWLADVDGMNLNFPRMFPQAHTKHLTFSGASYGSRESFNGSWRERFICSTKSYGNSSNKAIHLLLVAAVLVLIINIVIGLPHERI
jgi:hypothetical protein